MTADPIKYLNDFENSLKKHTNLVDKFQNFKVHVFSDVEEEQVYCNFIITYPYVYQHYISLVQNYHALDAQNDEKELNDVGIDIFNVIMPYT